MHNVAGLGSRGSARAFNLLMKAKYLDELTGSKGLTFASGTPVFSTYQIRIISFTVHRTAFLCLLGYYR